MLDDINSANLEKAYNDTIIDFNHFICSALALMGQYSYDHNGIFKMLDTLQFAALGILNTLSVSFRPFYSLIFVTVIFSGFIIRDGLRGTINISDIYLIGVIFIAFLFKKIHIFVRNIESFNKNRIHHH